MLFQIRGMIDQKYSFLKFSCRNLISIISTPEALRNCFLKRSKDSPKHQERHCNPEKVDDALKRKPRIKGVTICDCKV